jgi:DUF971 family protein
VHLQLFKRTSPDQIACSWSDGHHGIISFRGLRDACPCAGCAGETVLFRHAPAIPVDPETPGRYELRTAIPVGNYGLKLEWGDGHADGIYTWEHLRAMCECAQCRAAAAERKGEWNG